MIKTYAEIDNNNKVVNTIIAAESFVASVPGTFIECTESTRLGSIGMTYNKEKNKFINPQPYPSWTLNEDSLDWESPAGGKPDNENVYIWDEENRSWVLFVPVNIEL
jgi:hypothetical protein